LFEHIHGTNYQQFLSLLNRLHVDRKAKKLAMSKLELKELLTLAQSDRERESLRYVAYKASGISATAARKQYGLERMDERVQRIENCVKEAQAIRESIESICQIHQKEAFASFGIAIEDESDGESDIESDSEDCDTASEVEQKSAISLPDESDLLEILKQCEFNWFELISHVEEACGCMQMSHGRILEEFFGRLLAKVNKAEGDLLTQSHAAYLAILQSETPMQERETAALNGDVVSESDSDDPDMYVAADNLQSEEAKVALQKRLSAIQRKSRRQRATEVAHRNFLARKRSKKVGTILHKFPGIGKEIEKFVEDRSVGADAWRRTGVLTFDGNKSVGQKVTYQRIREHLQAVYNCTFSYGTVVQLCVARNKRRKSASYYKGVARVTSRRARKGFQLKFNPDNHWRASLYKGLNWVQYSDGRNIVNINQDDVAGFRLDTLTTHRQHHSPVVRGHEILTTRTDFVSSYPSLLLTTNYNFSKTTTSGKCVWV